MLFTLVLILFSKHFRPLRFIIGIFLIMFLINRVRLVRNLGKQVISGISGIQPFFMSMVIVTWIRLGVEEILNGFWMVWPVWMNMVMSLWVIS
jgi:hypothetical protein